MQEVDAAAVVVVVVERRRGDVVDAGDDKKEDTGVLLLHCGEEVSNDVFPLILLLLLINIASLWTLVVA